MSSEVGADDRRGVFDFVLGERISKSRVRACRQHDDRVEPGVSCVTFVINSVAEPPSKVQHLGQEWILNREKQEKQETKKAAQYQMAQYRCKI